MKVQFSGFVRPRLTGNYNTEPSFNISISKLNPY